MAFDSVRTINQLYRQSQVGRQGRQLFRLLANVVSTISEMFCLRVIMMVQTEESTCFVFNPNLYKKGL